MSLRARIFALTLLLIAIALGGTMTAGAANAHAARVSVDPAENAAISTGPARVRATFN
jgi:methionine-rich copper-binding protein CopC